MMNKKKYITTFSKANDEYEEVERTNSAVSNPSNQSSDKRNN